MTAHTPGPWRWELDEKNHSIDLRTSGERLGGVVMDFVRFGMSSAAPRFRNGPVLVRADSFGAIEKGREHHADWFKRIDHPDARLIAAAPDLLAALRSLVDLYDDRTSEEWKAGMAAIAKAEGDTEPPSLATAPAAPTPGPDFWSCSDDDERLSHEEIEEAVCACIEDQAELNESWRSAINRLAPLKVYGWTRDVIDDKEIARLADWAMESITDNLAEKSDPDGNSDALKIEAATKVEAAIVEALTEARTNGQLVPWTCEVTETRELTEAELLEMFKSEVEDDDHARAAHTEGGGQ